MTPDSDRQIHVLGLFHRPTFAFRDVKLQFLGHLFEFFHKRRIEGKTEGDRTHLSQQNDK